MGEGFLLSISVPPGITGAAPMIVGMYPESLWARYGGPVAMYSDYTLRNESGAVVWDGHKEQPGKVFTGGGIDSRDVARNGDGSPLLPRAGDPRDSGTTGGAVPGEQVNTAPLFIAGTMQPEPVYDNSAHGGWGAPVTTAGGMGYPSSWARRDDRWVTYDGKVIDAQQTVLGVTSDQKQAARELQAKGPTPSIRWTGQQVIYSAALPDPSSIVTVATPGGGTVTTDGTGRVVSSSPPGGTQVQTLFSPAAPPPTGWAGTEDAAGSPAPVVVVSPHVTKVLPGTDSVTGRPLTDSAPGSGGGTTTRPTSAVVIEGGPPALVPGGSDVTVIAGVSVPTWALWLGGAVLAVTLLGRR